MSVNNYGEVDWADDATSGTFALSCTLNGVTGTSGTITLIIGSDPIPTPTSITIYGSQDLTGVGGYSGLSDYTATDNNGHILVGCTWTIENQTCSGVTVNGNGQVRWTDKATSGTFDLRCTKSGLSDGVLTGIAIDITNPLPPGPGPMPTSCLEKSSDGKTCYGIRAGTDLSLYSEIDIPEGVEIIVSNSFSGRISSGYSYALKLPNSIATIGDYAFYECHGLHEIYFGSNYQQTLGKDVFMDYGYSPNGLKKIVASFQQQPNWGSSARNEFTNANDNGTVENLDSRYSSSSFLFYLEVVCCLPQTWRAIA